MIRLRNLPWLIPAVLASTSGCGGADAAPARETRSGDAPAPQPVGSDTAEWRRARRTAEVHERQRSMPRFEDHPAHDTFAGTPAAVDLPNVYPTPAIRTALREGAAAGPNFAGHFTVVEWGCGTGCQLFAIVDARTGTVTMGTRPLSVGAEYRRDSELFIADPPARWLQLYGADATDAIGSLAASIYYRWNGRSLVPLDSLAIGRHRRW